MVQTENHLKNNRPQRGAEKGSTMTKNIFEKSIKGAIDSFIKYDAAADRIEGEKWGRDRKAMIAIFETSIKQIAAGSSRTAILAALKSGFKDAIQATPSQESEVKAFRPPILRALEAMDFETATPETVAEFVNGFEKQGQWRAFWRKPQATPEGNETTETTEPTTKTTETTDADREKAILAILDGCDDANAVLEGVIAARKA